MAAEGDSNTRFESTHWSVVLAAARTSSPEAEAALEKLCRDYWYPLYAFLRRKGQSPEEARDLTQEFFVDRVINRRVLRGVEAGGARFRSWLLACLENFTANHWQKNQAQKRGGGFEHLSLDFQDAEGRYLHEPADFRTPDRLYERAWALTLLNRALEQVRSDHERDGKSEQFEALKEFLPGEESHRTYADVARTLGKTEESIKMAVSRLRQQYGRQLREEIKRTVSQPGEVDAELRSLLEAIGS